MITENTDSLKNKFNIANPNIVPDGLRIVKFGNVLRAIHTALRKKTVAASSYQLGTLQALALPDDGKAHSITRAYARSGAGTVGELAVQAYGAAPAAGQIAVAPNGDIVVLAADAWTSIDVSYQPEKYDLIELTLPVVPGTGVCALPTAVTAPGLVNLLEAEVLAGGSLGKKIILVPAAAAPAAGRALYKTTGDQVLFAIADAVTSARVKLAVCASTDIDALLEAQSSIA